MEARGITNEMLVGHYDLDPAEIHAKDIIFLDGLEYIVCEKCELREDITVVPLPEYVDSYFRGKDFSFGGIDVNTLDIDVKVYAYHLWMGYKNRKNDISYRIVEGMNDER